MTRSIEADVLVVGAGPTGLTLAAELLRHGLRPLVVEKDPAPSGLSRAIVVHARTLEVLEPHGIAPPLVEAGVPLRRVRMWSGGQVAVDVSFDGLPTAYPFLLSIPQTDTERILADRVAALGGEVVRGVELRSLRADPDGVEVELTDRREGRPGVGPGAGLERVRAAWVVGCDGAHSTVRHALGIEFRGHAYEERLVLGDVRWDVDLPRDALSTFFAADGLLACFPLPGEQRFRLIATVEPDGGADPAAPLPELTVDDLAALVEQRSPCPARLADPRWLARFRIHARQVDRYRAGRVLIAGDAAHIHSPAGGQGMNTGIQDAHNLAWKLALVHRGAPDVLLDSYEAERHPLATRLLRATDAATRLGTARNPAVRWVRDRAAGLLSRWSLATDRILRGVAELDVDYAGSPIVEQDASGGPAAGTRLPGLPVDTRHLLLPLAGPAIDEAGRRRLRICAAIAAGRPDRLGVGAAPSALGVAGDGVAVVRPDGYLGLVLSPADPERLMTWLDRVLGSE